MGKKYAGSTLKPRITWPAVIVKSDSSFFIFLQYRESDGTTTALLLRFKLGYKCL
jgi:hypothetical protein